jgi:6-phosphogluconolactonase
VSAAELRVLDDPIRVCADEMLAAARGRPGAHIVLTGGSTPKPAYRLAAQDPGAFERTTLWFGDERCVPPDDERSNYAMARRSLLDPLQAAGAHPICHRMPAEHGSALAASEYELLLRDTWPSGDPGFDLVLLGMGSDGHTLSLFPGKPEVTERELLVVGVPVAGLEPFVPRVSLTMSALAGAVRVIVLALGASKANAVLGAFGPDAVATPEVPASMLSGVVAPGALIVMLDAGSAARL